MTFPDAAMGGPAAAPAAGRGFSSGSLEESLPAGGTAASSRDEATGPDDPPLDFPASQGIHLVPLSALRPADSPRLAGEDENHTRRLAETEAELPPILVHRATMRVIDGMHRLRAATASGKQEIRVRFFDGDENEAFLHAVRENVTHGLPLTLDDRRAAALRIIASSSQLSDRAIGKYTGLSDKTVSAIRDRSTAESPQSSKRVGIDGRTRPLNSSEGRRHAMELMTARPDASLREVAAQAGISVGTAHDVRKRMQRGEDPLHTRQHHASLEHPPPAGLPGQIVAARRSARDVTDFDPRSLLESLVQDPAIRQSESGRGMLRWLHAHAVRGADVDQFVGAVPPHRIDCAISLAEQCAGVWHRIADRLAAERKLHDRSGAA